jgi:hypothetical protein
MIDPHGEYSAAFKNHGELFNVDNLAMPYWLMNFEEHCEVFVTSQGADRQVDQDILAKCLLTARQRNRLADQIGKITVDSPIPYLLSDLLNVLQNEMGKLDKGTNSIPYMRLKTKIEEVRGDPRYQFMFSGMLVGDTMARQRQADLDHRRFGRTVGNHLHGGRGAQPPGVRLCDLGAR